jgi:tryptophan-rich sensory protein
LGIAAFLVVLTTLMAALRRYERFSAWLLVPYTLWVLYDLAWTYALWRLNGARPAPTSENPLITKFVGWSFHTLR